MSKRALVRSTLLAAIWIVSAVGLAAQGPAENPAQACAAKNQTDAATVGAYQFTAYKSSDGACVQVTSGGKTVYSQSVDSFETFTLGQPGSAQDNIPVIARRDRRDGARAAGHDCFAVYRRRTLLLDSLCL